MIMIETKYLGPTDRRGARIRVKAISPKLPARTYPYDHAARNPDLVALARYVRMETPIKPGRWTGCPLKRGVVWVREFDGGEFVG